MPREATKRIAIREGTAERLRDRQPYDSMTYDDVIRELLDETEGDEKRVVVE